MSAAYIFESYFCLPYAPECLAHTEQQIKEFILASKCLI